MSGFRGAMTVRRVRTFLHALAVLASVTRHDDDPYAVRITITAIEDGRYLGALDLGLLPLTELGDAVRARSTEITRQPRPADPARPRLRVVHPTDSFPATDESRNR